jgi:hypothetical protein
MLRVLAIILGVLIVAACAHAPRQEPMPKSAAECSARGGDWTSFVALYPRSELSTLDKRRYICNMRTNDGGNICSDRAQCQGLCIAPATSVVGQTITGQCSVNVLVPESTRFVGNGVVLDPTVLE